MGDHSNHIILSITKKNSGGSIGERFKGLEMEALPSAGSEAM